VQAKSGSLPDWRDAAAYAPLLGADRSLFAWEWLRRDPDYIEAADENDAGDARARDFGLVRFEAPDRHVPAARPLWVAEIHPYVLQLRGGVEGGPEDSFALERFAILATLANSTPNDHLLLSDGLRTVRLDGPAGTFTSGPRKLHYALQGLAAAERPLVTLRRFLALCRSGHFSRALHRSEPRARRWILMLRAHDGLLAGASQRDIARVLLSRTAGEPRWRSRESSVRAQAQRLVRSARQISAGAYRLLLR
jgi:hypothetical protein